MAATVAAVMLAGCGGGGGGEDTSAPPTNTSPGTNSLTAPTVQAQVTQESYSLSFTSSSTGLTYQWQRSTDAGTSWTNVGGSGTSPFVYGFNADDLSMDGHQYRLRVSDGTNFGASAPITVSVTASAPTIQVQPQNQTIVFGSNAVFSVSAFGASRTYQWQSSANNGATWQDVTGGNGLLLTVPRPAGSETGKRYRVVVTTALGSIISSEATLTVQVPIAKAYVLHAGDNRITRVSILFDGSLELATDAGGTPLTLALNETPYRAVLSPTGDALIAHGASTYNVLRFDANGALTNPAGARSHTRNPPFEMAFSPNGQWVYAFTGGADTAQFRMTAQGLEALSPPWVSAPMSVGGFVGPTGSWAISAGVSNGLLSTFAIASDGKITATAISTISGLGSVRGMTAHPTGTRAYVQVNDSSSTLHQFSVDAAGTVTALSPASVTGGGSDRPVISPDGLCLFAPAYTTGIAAGSIATFRINGDGTLSAGSPARTATPRAFSGAAITPDSRYLISTHDGVSSPYGSGFLSVFGISNTCALTAISSTTVSGSSAPVGIVIR